MVIRPPGEVSALRTRRTAAAALLLSLGTPGCTSSYWRSSADREVADILRASDLYVTASRHEACSNALLEALACGLPAAFVQSGSNGELVGDAGIGFEGPEDVTGAVERLAAELDERRARITVPALADVADRYLEVLRG